MKSYIEQLKAHLADQQPDYSRADIHSLLDFLWHCYTESNPINTREIRDCYLTLDPIFESLPFDDSNALFSTVCNLCEVTEHAAFIEGIHVGMRLYLELSQLCD